MSNGETSISLTKSLAGLPMLWPQRTSLQQLKISVQLTGWSGWGLYVMYLMGTHTHTTNTHSQEQLPTCLTWGPLRWRWCNEADFIDMMYASNIRVKTESIFYRHVLMPNQAKCCMSHITYTWLITYYEKPQLIFSCHLQCLFEQD